MVQSSLDSWLGKLPSLQEKLPAAVQSPLAIFVLTLLVVEALVMGVYQLLPEEQRAYALAAGLGMALFLVLLVASMAIWSRDVLLGRLKDTHVEVEVLPNRESLYLNSNRYIHDKFMLVDPLEDDPTVITGSANFSGASQTTNDENMLVIRSDQHVADIYFTEFMRLFDHFYGRYHLKNVGKATKRPQKKAKAGESGKGYLRTTADWLVEHFGDSRKSRRREYFHGPWEQH